MSATSGPWRVDDGCYTVRADALPLRGETGMDSGAVCVAVHSPADARLIAAAPDLVAALADVVAAMDLWETDQYTDDDALDRMSDLVVIARAALAKARGAEERGP